MGPGYFVIAILGCADGGTACTPVVTLQTRYASESECSAATTGALETNSNFDFPTLLARCKSEKATTSEETPRDKALSAHIRRG
jgi:hypothetical protein